MADMEFKTDFPVVGDAGAAIPKMALADDDALLLVDASGKGWALPAEFLRKFAKPVTMDLGTIDTPQPFLDLSATLDDGLGVGDVRPGFTAIRVNYNVETPGDAIDGYGGHSQAVFQLNGQTYAQLVMPTCAAGTSSPFINAGWQFFSPGQSADYRAGGIYFNPAGSCSITQGRAILGNGLPRPVVRFAFENPDQGWPDVGLMYGYGKNRFQMQLMDPETDLGCAFVIRNSGRLEYEKIDGVAGDRISHVGYILDSGLCNDFSNQGHNGGYITPLSATTCDQTVPIQVWSFYSGGWTDLARMDGYGRLQVDFGAAATPGFGFYGDEDTGLYRSSANVLGFATGGTGRWLMSSAGFVPATDATYDIGSAVATVRAIYASSVTVTADPVSAMQLTTKQYVDGKITALIGGAPGALDTLKELADAINDDASYAATIVTLLAAKAPLASPTFTGVPAGPTAAPGTNTDQFATTAFVQAGLTALKASPTLSGTVAVAGASSSAPVFVAQVTGDTYPRAKLGLDGADAPYLAMGSGAAAPDAILVRDAANRFAFRNGATSQGVSIYNSFTDASNYERANFTWAGIGSGLWLTIGTAAAGTGTARGIVFNSASGIYALGGVTASFVAFKRNGTEIQGRLADDTGFCDFAFRKLALAPANDTSGLTISGNSVTGSGATPLVDMSTTWNTTSSPTALKVTVTNTASGASAKLFDFLIGTTSYGSLSKGGKLTVADGFVAQGASGVIVANGTPVGWASRGAINASGDGVFQLTNNAGSGFGRVILGVSTSSGVAIAPSGTEAQIRLGDNSDFGDLAARKITANGAFKRKSYTVATLPAVPADGDEYRVTDASAPVYGSTVAGGGTRKVPVTYDSTLSAWIVS